MIRNLNTIRSEGYRILVQELGAANTAIFLRQFENGIGNYTQERQSTLDENSVDLIAERIKKRKEDLLKK